MMHPNLMLYSGCKAAGDWHLWYPGIYFCVLLSKERRFLTVSVKEQMLLSVFFCLSKDNLYYTDFNVSFWPRFRSFCFYLCEKSLQRASQDTQSASVRSRTAAVK